MKKHLPLIIGVSLPFVMILIVILSVNLPRTFINPQHSFLYTASTYNNECNRIQIDNKEAQCRTITYTVENGKITEKVNVNNYNTSTQKLYLYDIVRDSTREITPEEAAKYTLSNESRSPDGYEVVYEYGGNAGIFDLFGGGYENSRWVVKKGIASKPLSVTGMADRYYYYSPNQIAFLGWILN